MILKPGESICRHSNSLRLGLTLERRAGRVGIRGLLTDQGDAGGDCNHAHRNDSGKWLAVGWCADNHGNHGRADKNGNE